MPEVSSRAGLLFEWGATHKRGGRLISRQVSIKPPEITCPRLSCWVKFPIKALQYLLVCQYQHYRTDYAEAYPDIYIVGKYRTGEDCPERIWSSIWEIIKLKTRRRITWLKTKKYVTRG